MNQIVTKNQKVKASVAKRGPPLGQGSRGIREQVLTRLSSETCDKLLNKLISKALNGQDGEGDATCLMFLASKFLPNCKNGNIDVSDLLPQLNSIENIDAASNKIFELTSRGNISLDQGDMLMSLVERRRKCYETNVLTLEVEKIKRGY